MNENNELNNVNNETPVVDVPVTEVPSEVGNEVSSDVTPEVTNEVVVEAPAEVTAEPVVETPVVETPVAEIPVVDVPVAETPVVEATPVSETTTMFEQTITPSEVVSEPVVEAPVVEAAPEQYEPTVIIEEAPTNETIIAPTTTETVGTPVTDANAIVDATKKKSNPIILIILGVIVVVAIVLLIVTNVNKGKKPGETPEPTPTPNPGEEKPQVEEKPKDALLLEDVSLSGYSCMGNSCVFSGQNEETFKYESEKAELLKIARDYDELKVNLYYTENETGEKTIVDFELYVRSTNEKLVDVKNEEDIRVKLGLYTVGTYTETLTLTEIGMTGAGIDGETSYAYTDYVFTDSKDNKYEMRYKFTSEGLILSEGSQYKVNFEVKEGTFDYEFNIISVE